MIGLADVDGFKICFKPLYLITSFKQISFVLTISQHESGKILQILMQLISGNIEVV